MILPKRIASLGKVIVLCLFLALVACEQTGTSGGLKKQAPHSKPNILVILVDTLRADHLGAYGHARDTSPNIDRLAGEGVLFEEAFSASSYTRESVSSLFSGKFPSSNPWGTGWMACPDPDSPGMASIFKQNGYETSVFYNNPIITDKVFLSNFDNVKTFKGDSSLSGAEELLSKAALEHLDGRNSPNPFLMYIHYLDPHSPFAPSDEYYHKFKFPKYESPITEYEARGNLPGLLTEGFGPGEARFEDMKLRYDAEIRATDSAVGILLDGLEERGLDENTIVVFLADHGEEFLEHGFIEHCWDLRRESIHVPLIFRWTNSFNPKRIKDAVSTVNVLPTLLKLAGIAIPDTFDGYPLFENGDWQTRDVPIVAELMIQSRIMMRMIMQGDYAFFSAIQWFDTAEKSEISMNHQQIVKEFQDGTRQPRDIWADAQKEFLYNIKNDPLQHVDILESHAEIAEQFRQKIEAYRKTCPPNKSDTEQRNKTEFGLTPEMTEKLKNLNYL